MTSVRRVEGRRDVRPTGAGISVARDPTFDKAFLESFFAPIVWQRRLANRSQNDTPTSVGRPAGWVVDRGLSAQVRVIRVTHYGIDDKPITFAREKPDSPYDTPGVSGFRTAKARSGGTRRVGNSLVTGTRRYGRGNGVLGRGCNPGRMPRVPPRTIATSRETPRAIGRAKQIRET